MADVAQIVPSLEFLLYIPACAANPVRSTQNGGFRAALETHFQTFHRPLA